MKKHLSKLDDLVQAARTEQPVVSFEETARQVRLMAEKQRKPLWTLLRDAWAFPLRQIQRFTQGFTVQLPSESAWNVVGLMQGGAVRGFAGVCAAALVLVVFPALIHDLSYSLLKRSTVAENIAGNQAASVLVSKGDSPKTVHNNLAQNADNKKHLGQITHSSASATIPPAVTEGNAISSLSVAVIVDSVSTDSAQKTNTMLSNFALAEYGLSAVLRKSSVEIAMNTPINTPSTANNTKSVEQNSNKSAQEYTTPSSDAALDRVLPSEEQGAAQGFWQRVSLEARIAARTDIGTQTGNVASSSQTFFSANQDQRPFSQNNTASTPLQNVALGMYYAVNEHHTVGIEGGTEPFFTAQMQQVTQAPDMQGGNNSLVGITSMPSGSAPSNSLTTNRTQTVPVRSASNRTWFGAAYQYNAEAWDVLGGVQPLARITIGGGELGAVGRTLVGAKFLSRERFSFVLAGEGAAVASQLLGTWNLTPRLGVTLGLSVKF